MGCTNSLPVAEEFFADHDPSPNEYGGGLISTKPIQLKVRQKLFSLRGDFTVKDSDGTAYCKVVGILLSMRQRVLIKEVKHHGKECFADCADPSDETSACWINCFYETLMGDSAGNTTRPTGGMSLRHIEAAWMAGFAQCPTCPPPPASCPEDVLSSPNSSRLVHIRTRHSRRALRRVDELAAVGNSTTERSDRRRGSRRATRPQELEPPA